MLEALTEGQLEANDQFLLPTMQRVFTADKGRPSAAQRESSTVLVTEENVLQHQKTVQ